MQEEHNKMPKDGMEGLKENWKTDSISGFLVFLLALPLSLGIAKASGFDPAMGVLTAMIGGLFVSFFRVSPLTIKGPAAGLITVCAAAITDLGALGLEGHNPVHLACAAIVTMALIQILFGFLKLGSLSDFFPHSAVHGMLAAIGIIIIAKQIPVLMGDDPSVYKGETPIQLLMDIPKFVGASNFHLAVVGIVSLIIMFALPLVKVNFLKKVPAPMIVLLIAIPLGIYWHFKHDYSLVKIGNFWQNISISADFAGIGTYVFWKYVFMFLFVNSLESLLTVKAIDGKDPYKRESSYNGDLIGLGAGNAVSGLLGGLPMISEVVRSGSNVGFGARTKWANFFHGLFLLIAMLLMIPVIEMIPNAALAAMLIFAGYRLAAPKEFISTYKIGKEQLAIFLITIIVTLMEDLLLGVGAGILVKFLFHLYNGASPKSLFKARYELLKTDHLTQINVRGSAVFSNLIGYKKVLTELPANENVVVDFSDTRLVDHSFMEFVHHFEHEYNAKGGNFKITGLENHKALSEHRLATRKKK
jgi:MFS superfamily sulfate permease-like transporter